jgi:hypothetical protein
LVAKVVTDPETNFEEELHAFDNDVDLAIQCFYTWQTVHAAARKSRKVYDLLNQNAAFWVLALGSVQANSLIALGRIFDKDNRTHNVSRLLRLAEENPAIFSKAVVRRRKTKDLANASHLVDDFMSNVKEPLALDFKRLRSFAGARCKVYERCYKQLRDKVYAHKERTNISGFVAKTNTLELGRLVSDLRILHGVLWHWLRNGRAPRLSPLRHSAGKQITRDTRKFLRLLVSGSSV